MENKTKDLQVVNESIERVNAMTDDQKADIIAKAQLNTFDFPPKLKDLADGLSGTITSFEFSELVTFTNSKGIETEEYFLRFTTVNPDMDDVSIPVSTLKKQGISSEKVLTINYVGMEFTHTTGYGYEISEVK